MQAMARSVFRGSVDDAGKFRADDAAALKRRVKAFAGKRAEIVVRAQTSQRSLDQNAYLHAVPFPVLADFFGYSIEEVKYALMGTCFGWRYCTAAGREIPVKPSTASMTVQEASFFIDWLIPWAASEHGVILPLPDEADYGDEDEH